MSKRADTPATAPSERDRFLALCEARDRERSHVRHTGARSDVYLAGLYRQFAAWIGDGAQPGAHLRAQEKGGVRSSAFRGDHNWVYLAKLDWDALPAAIAESRRISAMRGAGRPDSGELYKPLAAALKVATQPPTGLHAGGPRAKALGREQELATALCMRCVERLRHRTRPGDKATLARLSALIGKSVRYEVLWPAANALPYGTDKAKRAADEAESAAVQMVRAVLGCGYGTQKCLPFVTKALVRAVREIETNEGPAAAAAFSSCSTRS